MANIDLHHFGPWFKNCVFRIKIILFKLLLIIYELTQCKFSKSDEVTESDQLKTEAQKIGYVELSSHSPATRTDSNFLLELFHISDMIYESGHFLKDILRLVIK